jgi:hypothetical protein
MKLYHATMPSRIASIMTQGLRPPVHLTNESGYAAALWGKAHSLELIGIKEIFLSGPEPITFPQFIEHDECWVLEIDTSLLYGPNLHTDYSHLPGFYPDSLVCFRYDGTIEPAAIKPVSRWPVEGGPPVML